MGLQPFSRTKIFFIADRLHARLTARWRALNGGFTLGKRTKESLAALTEVASFKQNSTSPGEK